MPHHPKRLYKVALHTCLTAGIVASTYLVGCETALAQTPTSFIEFVNGKRLTYSTSGNPKAKGIELSFDYPQSWTGADGKRPNTLYQVTSQQGKGLELCNLVIKEIQLPQGTKITQRAIEELFNPANLKDITPQDAQFITGNRTTIDGQPAAWIKFRQKIDRAGIVLLMDWVMFEAYYDQKLIIFGCGVADSANKTPESVARRFDAHFPLFQQIANSLIIHSKWKK